METLQVQIVHIENNGKEEEDYDGFHIQALDQNSTPYYLRIVDYPISCYVELPRYIGRRFKRWTDSGAQEVYGTIKRRLASINCEILPCKKSLEFRLKMNYYSEIKHPVLLLHFKSVDDVKGLRTLLKKPLYVKELGEELMLNIWEDDNSISPITKLLVDTNVGQASCIRCEGDKVPIRDRISTSENEYIIKWETINLLDEAITDNWKVRPSVVAIDIETYSDNHRKLPDPLNPKHRAYITSLIFKQRGIDGGIVRYAIIVGKCGKIQDPKLADALVFELESEIAMIHMMAAIIEYEDPDILTGFNIQAYDYQYLDIRIRREGLEWPVMGRLKGVKAYVKDKGWESRAHGYMRMDYFHTPGRISIDVIKFYKRSIKLPTYTLDAICKMDLGCGKHPISAPEMFTIYEGMMSALEEGEQSPNYQTSMEKMAEVVAYCIWDSELVLKLMEKRNMWIGITELAKVTETAPYDLYTRGQQVRCISMIYRAMHNAGYIMDRIPVENVEYIGGIVIPPVFGLHDNVITLDFASLYPSIVRGNNMCYTTLIKDDATYSDDDCIIIPISTNTEDSDSEDEEKCTTKAKLKKLTEVRFHKKREGILPKIMTRLCNDRSTVRQKQKTEEDKFKWGILEERQLAYKVAANAMYGFLGIQQGAKFPAISIANAITSYGRSCIGKVNDYLTSTYDAAIVYGDTDSTMIKLPQITSPLQCKEWGRRLEKELSALFPPPMKMEFEEASRALLIKKKRYGKMKIDLETGDFVKDESGKYAMTMKGVLAARRDNCRWSRIFYSDLLYGILTGVCFEDSFLYIMSEVYRLTRNELAPEDLQIVKSVKSSYKLKTYPMNIFAERLRKAGAAVESGERIYYLVVEHPDPNCKLGEKFVTPSEFIESLDTEAPKKIDAVYYINKVMGANLNLLFYAGYRTIIDTEFEKYRRVRTPRCRKTFGLDTISELITFEINDGNSLEDFTDNTLDYMNQGEEIVL